MKGYLSGLILGVACMSCSSTRQERNVVDQSYQDGVNAAQRDLADGNAVIYVNALIRLEGTDPDTGLPYRIVGTDAVPASTAAWVTGYNTTVKAHYE